MLCFVIEDSTQRPNLNGITQRSSRPMHLNNIDVICILVSIP